jgi:hypothetical protein
MSSHAVIEIKAFVPSKDFELSKKFYSDLGFALKWSSDRLTYLVCETSSFLLQNFYIKERAENFMVHMLVDNADEWWSGFNENNIAAKYNVDIGDPEDRDWDIRDFTLIDPSGVLWRNGNVI